MAELDLIPEDYRNTLRQRAMTRQHVIAFVILNIIILVSSGLFAQLSQQAMERVQYLKSQSAITEQQQSQLEQLSAQQTEYERRWSLLQGLRAGAAVEDIFRIIDQALVDDALWFVNWRFRRAGVVVDGEPRGIETGYFVIVPADEQSAETPEWQVETHMTLEGQARDHQALSTFVRSLFEQTDIKDVSVQRTSLTDYANGRVVSFDLTIVLNSDVERI
ncbi:MAG: PilN domain-containing protein [Gammaproteobacteria bacterium]|jgi:cell division protein FtsB|nr:PilN domain-containing protein [Gammaproteobacteria bacterium]